MTTATTETTTLSTTSPKALTERLRGKWEEVPKSIRSAWDQVGEKVRNALELPTKDDIAKLAARLDEIEARLEETFSRPKGNNKTVAEKRVKVKKS